MGPTQNDNLEETPKPQSEMSGVAAPGLISTLPVKKSKKGLLIGLIAAGVLIVALASSAAAYTFIHNNPDKAVADALEKFFTAKSMEVQGTMDVTSKSGTSTSKITVNFNGAKDATGQAVGDQTVTVASGGKDMTLKIHTANSKDSVYVKLEDVKKLIENAFSADSSTAASLEQYYGKLIDKVDNKWVVIKYSELDALTNGSVKGSQVTCVMDQMDKLQNDATTQKELRKAYDDNRFLKVESKGSDTDGNHYVLTTDAEKAKTYGKALKDTAFFKAVDDCLNGQMTKSVESPNKTTNTTEETPVVELWVDGWSHNPNKMAISFKNKTSESKIEFKSKFNTNPKLSLPSGQTTINDIKDELQNLQDMVQQEDLPGSPGVY